MAILHFKDHQPNSQLTMETQVVTLSPPFSSRSLGLIGGRYICCSIKDSHFIEDDSVRTSDRYQEHDEGPLLSSMWDAIVQMRGSIIQRKTPEGARALSLYLPIIFPEEYS